MDDRAVCLRQSCHFQLCANVLVPTDLATQRNADCIGTTIQQNAGKEVPGQRHHDTAFDFRVPRCAACALGVKIILQSKWRQHCMRVVVACGMARDLDQYISGSLMPVWIVLPPDRPSRLAGNRNKLAGTALVFGGVCTRPCIAQPDSAPPGSNDRSDPHKDCKTLGIQIDSPCRSST